MGILWAKFGSLDFPPVLTCRSGKNLHVDFVEGQGYDICNNRNGGECNGKEGEDGSHSTPDKHCWECRVAVGGESSSEVISCSGCTSLYYSNG